MIKHVVCFKLKSQELVQTWIERSQMLAGIETVQSFSAAPLLKQEAYHCALYMEFEDEAALVHYQQHPTHQQYLKEVLPAILEDKLVVDLLA